MHEALAAFEARFYDPADPDLASIAADLALIARVSSMMAEITGISREPLISNLETLGASAAAILAVVTLPGIELAWASGVVEDAEYEAAHEGLAAAAFSSTIGRRLLDAWLSRRPGPELFSSWESAVAALSTRLEPRSFRQLRDESLARAKMVARSAGGFFGFLSISRTERSALRRIRSAFR